MSPLEPEAVRGAVNRTYSGVAPPSGGMLRAGYTAQQLATMPEGVSFFGCGNPLAFASVRPGDTVLDLGSGAGFDLILAGQIVGGSGRVIGVDMTDAMIDRARANIVRAGLTNVEVRKGVIEELPVEDASVDWVISNCVISLSPEKQRVFDEISRVLRPGGHMVISDIVVDDVVARLLRVFERLAPSIAMARPESVYLDAMARAGLLDPTVLGRLVYDADDLLTMFAEDVTREMSGGCPLDAWRGRLARSGVGQGALRVLARQAAGRVWSSKLKAHKRA